MSLTKAAGSSKDAAVVAECLTDAQMFQKARKEAALKVPIKRGQQYNAAVKSALLRIKKEEARKLVHVSDEAEEDAEDEMDDEGEDIIDDEDDNDEEWLDDEDMEADSSDSAVNEVAMYEKMMNTKDPVVRRASSSSATGKSKPLSRRDSGKSLASSSGSLGPASKLPKKRTAQQALKKYGETGEPATGRKPRASKAKPTQVDDSEESDVDEDEVVVSPPKKRSGKAKSEMIMHEDGEGGVSMDIADGSTQLSLTPFLCHIGDDVHVKVSKFRTKWYVCIREFKEGRAQNRGINLELCMIKKLKAAIDAAVLHTKM